MDSLLNKALISIVFCFITSVNLWCQEKIEVKDVDQATSKGTQPGYTVFIKDATLDNVTKKWAQYMKNEKPGDIFKSKDDKVKYEMKAGEYLAERAIVREISNKFINTIAVISNTGGGVQITAFFQLDSVFISKQTLGSTYTDTRNYLRNFAVACYKDAVKSELTRENNKLEELNSKLESLKEKKSLLEKRIVNSNAEISEQELQLRTNTSDQERSNQNLKIINDSISKMPVNSPGYTVYSNRLKEENKTLKHLLNENASIHKKIENSKLDIVQSNESIKQNIADQEYQTKQIGLQQTIANTVKTKYENIR